MEDKTLESDDHGQFLADTLEAYEVRSRVADNNLILAQQRIAQLEREKADLSVRLTKETERGNSHFIRAWKLEAENVELNKDRALLTQVRKLLAEGLFVKDESEALEAEKDQRIADHKRAQELAARWEIQATNLQAVLEARGKRAEQLEAENAEMRKRLEWQPINTFPYKTCIKSSVLVWCEERGNTYTAFWDSCDSKSATGWYHFGGGAGKMTETPTHWMPLPHPFDERLAAMKESERCPTCGSPQRYLHPALQSDGEVQPCRQP